MISRLKINWFRGITECDISGFKNINIFAGRNNQGKSSILEALFLTSSAFLDRDQFARKENKMVYLINRRNDRNLSWENARQTLWHNYTTEEPILIQVDYPATEHSGEVAELKVEFDASSRDPYILIPKAKVSETLVTEFFGPQPPGRRPDYLRFSLNDCSLHWKGSSHTIRDKPFLLDQFISNFDSVRTYMVGMSFIDADLMHNMEKVENALWNDLLKERSDKLVTDVLRDGYQIGIEDLTYMPMVPNTRMPQGIFQLAAKLKKTTVRVDDLGDGARYSMIWIMVATLARNTAILIEEPESHQHPGGLIKSLEALLDLAKKNNVQIFATTHSLEFIKFIEKLAQERSLGISTFFIEMDERGRIESRTITSEDSQYLAKMGLDIRFLDLT
jgi:hypothetical protein